MEQVLFIVCAVATLLHILWRVDQQREYKQKLLSDEWEKKRLSDEEVAEAQAELEKRLEKNIDLPDAVRNRDAFVYWNLMRTWFASLKAAKRYSDTGSDKLKSAWLDYMDLMEERAITSFLRAEAETEEKRAAYWEEEFVMRKKITIIEMLWLLQLGKKQLHNCRM